jgi:hypothetical protein
MPPWLTEVLKLLSFTTPFVYAAATYAIFHFLDRKASDAAKRALTERLQSTRRQNVAIPNFAVETFDLVYTSPLLHWRAFLRCLSITTVVCVVVWYELGVLTSPRKNEDLDISLLGLLLMSIVIGNYLSLFAIRPWLVAAGRWPTFALFVAAIIGVAIVYACGVIRDLLLTVILGGIGKGVFNTIHYFIVLQVSGNAFSSADPIRSLLFLGCQVSLWFPLFALAVLMAQVLVWLFKSSGWMQWFVKQGQHQPFQAVGYLAALIVFGVGVSAQILPR